MFSRLVFFCGALALSGCRGSGVDTNTGTGTGAGTGTGTGTGTGAGTGTGTGAGTGTGTGTGTGDSCTSPPGGAGPWSDVYGAHPIAAAGGSITGTPPSNDAGLGEIIAAATGEFSAVTVDLTVTDALVIARGYVPTTNDGTATFWMEDVNGVVQGYRVDTMAAGGVDPTDIEPGDTVTLHATAVQEYFGTMEITAIDSFSVVHGDTPVHVIDGMTGAPLNPANDHNYLVEVYGTLVTDPTDCGGKDCFELDYGSGTTVVFRTGAGFQFKDDCIHWIGPLGEFSNAAQLNADDYDWYRWW